MSEILAGAVALLLLAAAGSCYASRLRSRSVRRAAEELVARVEALRGGGRRARGPGDGREGLDAVADALDALASDLQAARREEQRLIQALEAARGTLEKKVRERTADLTRAYQELKSLDSMKDAFISSVSHELRTPLSSIRAFSEILVNRGSEDEATLKEFAGIIQQESDRLTRLVNDVLDLSRMEAGRLTLAPRKVDLAAAVQGARAAAAALVVESGIRLETYLPRDLPAVRADPDRLAQVLTNLLGNALKFTPRGGTVRIAARADGERTSGAAGGAVEVRVSDTGPGIPESDLETVFEKFRQVGDPLTGKPHGTGLGLAICRELVRRMGGSIRAERREGGGTTIVFTLPRAEHDEAAAPPRAGADLRGAAPPAAGPPRLPSPLHPGDHPADARPSPGRRPTIAVADDVPGIVGVVAESLEARGFDVLKAQDGPSALALARGRPLDLLILDLQMPGLTGWQVLRSLREDPRTASLPVILLTGTAAEKDRIRALSLGAVEYLMKGQGLARLCAEIEMATKGLPIV